MTNIQIKGTLNLTKLFFEIADLQPEQNSLHISRPCTTRKCRLGVELTVVEKVYEEPSMQVDRAANLFPFRIALTKKGRHDVGFTVGVSRLL